MSRVTLKSVTKSFGAAKVIRGVDLEVADGEFVVFVGPSGCGKSTLLRMIAGLEDISTGEIAIGDAVVNDVDPADRGIAMVFQTYALYPHMTARQNLSFGLRQTGNPKADTDRRVAEAARVLQIEPLMDRRPSALSGGQRQRVAIGRAIVREPEVFLFDEPLSNLDAELRVQMRVEIARLHTELGTTMIYVTHDQTEAMTLADRIVVLRAGLIEQVGTPLDLYRDPANRFVAGFIGSPAMNFLDATVEGPADGGAALRLTGHDTRIVVPLSTQPEPDTDVSLGIRPEHFGAHGTGEPEITLDIDVAEHLGQTTYVYSGTRTGQHVIVQRPEDDDHRPGGTLTVSIPPDRAFVFAEDGHRIR